MSTNSILNQLIEFIHSQSTSKTLEADNAFIHFTKDKFENATLILFRCEYCYELLVETASAKISPLIIKRILVEYDYFSESSFVSGTEANKLFGSFGIYERYNRKLYSNQISKITYRGKTIYER